LLLLPVGDFQIKSLDLVGTLAAPKELEKIAGLTALRELYLPGPMWTPVSDSQLDANDALKALTGLKNLERLYFSLHFLPTYNVTDNTAVNLLWRTAMKSQHSRKEADMGTKQKTVIVTGASQGIGASVVQTFLDRGRRSQLT